MRSRGVVVAIVVLIAAFWFGFSVLWRGNSGSGQSPATSRVGVDESNAARPPLSPSAVLSISASKPSAPINAPGPATLVQEFGRSSRLKPLYDRLKSGAGATADGKLALYLVLRECARVEGGVQRALNLDPKTLSAGISDANPDKPMRIRIAEELKARCEGFDGVVSTRAELKALLDESAAAGNHSARIRLLSDELGNTMKPGAGLSVTDGQLETLRQAVASGDPDAIQGAGTLLSNTFADMVIESRATHEAIEQGASYNAWRLLACEYGADCGASNAWLRAMCAWEGQCAALSVQDGIFFYEVSPNQAQLIDQYRAMFRNAARGDWSGLEFVRRPGGLGRQYYFSIP